MAVQLTTAVLAALEAGEVVALPLVRFDLPGINGGAVHSVGYHTGHRSYVHDGFEYRPNRFLDAADMVSGLGGEVTSRTLKFSNVTSSSVVEGGVDDAIARFEDFDYLNAPVIVSVLAGDPNSQGVLGVLVTDTYQINSVSYPVAAADDNGDRTFTVEVQLEPLGRTQRDSTQVRRNSETQSFDNNPLDTSMDRLVTVASVPIEWGQQG